MPKARGLSPLASPIRGQSLLRGGSPEHLISLGLRTHAAASRFWELRLCCLGQAGAGVCSQRPLRTAAVRTAPKTEGGGREKCTGGSAWSTEVLAAFCSLGLPFIGTTSFGYLIQAPGNLSPVPDPTDASEQFIPPDPVPRWKKRFLSSLARLWGEVTFFTKLDSGSQW